MQKKINDHRLLKMCKEALANHPLLPGDDQKVGLTRDRSADVQLKDMHTDLQDVHLRMNTIVVDLPNTEGEAAVVMTVEAKKMIIPAAEGALLKGMLRDGDEALVVEGTAGRTTEVIAKEKVTPLIDTSDALRADRKT